MEYCHVSTPKQTVMARNLKFKVQRICISGCYAQKYIAKQDKD
jgi:hypothetical protein